MDYFNYTEDGYNADDHSPNHPSSSDSCDRLYITIGNANATTIKEEPNDDNFRITTIPGLDSSIRSVEHNPARSIHIAKLEPVVIDHTTKTYEPEVIPEALLYSEVDYKTAYESIDDDSDDNYLQAIDLEYRGVCDPAVPPTTAHISLTTGTPDVSIPGIGSTPDAPIIIDGVQVDISQIPTMYATFLKEGASELVAEKLLALIDDKIFGDEDLEDDRAKWTFVGISKRSREDEVGVLRFLDEFRKTSFEGITDRVILFKKMFKRFQRGAPNLRPDAVFPLREHDQRRIDIFYSTDLAEGYKLHVSPGCRRFCKVECQGDESTEHNQLFIGRIPKECYEDEIVPNFSTVGKIRDLFLMMDASSNQTRGFAFLNFEDESLVDEAISKLDQTYIKPGRKIGVSRSIKCERLFFGGLPRHVTQEEAEFEFKRVFPGVTNVLLNKDYNDATKNRGFAFVDFKDHRCAREAIAMAKSGRFDFAGTRLTNSEWARVLDRPVEQDQLEGIVELKKVFIRGLDYKTTEESIYLAFIWFGDVEGVKRQGDYAIVHFANKADAISAVDKPPKEIDGKKVTVQWATPARKRYNNYYEHKNKAKATRWAPPGKELPPVFEWVPKDDHERRRKEEVEAKYRNKRFHGAHKSRQENARDAKKNDLNTNSYGWAWSTGKKPEKCSKKKHKQDRDKFFPHRIPVRTTREPQLIPTPTDFERKVTAGSHTHKFELFQSETQRLKARAAVLDFFDVEEDDDNVSSHTRRRNKSSEQSSSKASVGDFFPHRSLRKISDMYDPSVPTDDPSVPTDDQPPNSCTYRGDSKYSHYKKRPVSELLDPYQQFHMRLNPDS